MVLFSLHEHCFRYCVYVVPFIVIEMMGVS